LKKRKKGEVQAYVPKHSINDFDQLYRITKTGVGAVNQTVRVSLGRVAPKTLRLLTHVTVENKTNDGTKNRIGINAGSRDHYLDEIDDPLKDELIVERSDILLGEGDSFFAEFTGTQNGDELILTCVGWEQGL